MNLISGQTLSEDESRAQLDKLPELILQTHQGEKLSQERVIAACDALSRALDPERDAGLLTSLGMSSEKARRELATAKQMMSRAYLENRLAIELPPSLDTQFTPYGLERSVRHAWHPLGTLLHITAGNVDALPVFSVVEGLLTGNINILKLPGKDDGLSIPILQQLIHHYPLIANYVFVFDTPSTDLAAMEKMATCADAIVVWGSDEAVSAVRKLAQPDTQIIEWGHKISFAYVSSAAVPDADLEGIAYNICDTNQTLCNSCQGIYLDSDKFEDVVAFAERFAKTLNQMAADMPLGEDPFLTAQKTLEIYTEELEADEADKRVFREEHCSVIAYPDAALHPAYMFRNCWVKPLPKSKLLSELLPYKNHLQTVALVCEPEQKAGLEDLLAQTGIVRITTGERMSTSYCGMPHDGRFPLRRYMKIVSYDD
jgi:acyl-CoA reductase-like NAD-dependent aldehyde dehydrogenase